MRPAPNEWPAASAGIYRKLQSYEIVGASSCVAAIVGALRDLAESRRSDPRVVEVVASAGETFSALKPDTSAYATTARWLVRDLGQLAPAVAVEAIRVRAEAFLRYRDLSLARLVTQGVETVKDAQALLLHDWSSSVLSVLDDLGRVGLTKRLYLTWGQPLDKGPALAARGVQAGHDVRLIPDTAIGRVVPRVDAVLSGVETLCGDGSCVNTVGTYPIALVAARSEVPFYGVTECIKIDPTRVGVTSCGLSARLLHPWREDVKLPAGVRVELEVLDVTPAELVTGYITERGLLAPSDVGVALEQMYAELDAVAG